MSFAIAKKPSLNKTPHKKPHRAEITPKGVQSAPVLFVQPKATCACGGGCPRCKGEIDIQPKLKIGKSNDQYEQEADRVADQVMRMPAPQVQRQTEPEEEEDLAQA